MNSIEFQVNINYQFRNPDLLKQALTHSSVHGGKEKGSQNNNEKLEFLGDAFLDAVISEWLYLEQPEKKEGELSKMRALIVCEKSLANIAYKLGLPSHLLLGKGEEQSGGRFRDSILADSVEAIIGAIYLDGGYESVRNFVLMAFQDTIWAVGQGEGKADYKTALQENLQTHGTIEIRYVVSEEKGPDHDKMFYVNLIVEGNLISSGQGKTKKEAEQNAARAALERGEGVCILKG